MDLEEWTDTRNEHFSVLVPVHPLFVGRINYDKYFQRSFMKINIPTCILAHTVVYKKTNKYNLRYITLNINKRSLETMLWASILQVEYFQKITFALKSNLWRWASSDDIFRMYYTLCPHVWSFALATVMKERLLGDFSRKILKSDNMLIEAWNGSIYRWHGVSLWWKCLSTPFIYTLFYIIYIIYTFGYFTHTVYTHSLPCVFIHYMCFVCILRLHPCAKRYVLFRAISSSIHY